MLDRSFLKPLFVSAGLALVSQIPLVAQEEVAATAPTPAPAPTPALAPATEIRVLTWNLEWFPGRKPKSTQEEKDKQVAAVQAALVELKPDIILLQEVNDQAAAELAIAKLPDTKLAICSKFPGNQQVVIATRYPVDSGWAEEWKRTGKDDPPRGFNFAAIELPGAEKRLLLTYTFHFKSNRGSETKLQSNIAKREAAGVQLASHIQEMLPKYQDKGKLSWLLGGDCNTSLDDPKFDSEQTLRVLMKGGLKWVFDGIPATERETLPAEAPYPATTFDHVLFRDLDLVSVKVPLNYPDASDHRPILAVFKAPGEPATPEAAAVTPEAKPAAPEATAPPKEG
jgi:endonuclease/exonuclease/phosphatase (EEP) superfamily protein YafD